MLGDLPGVSFVSCPGLPYYAVRHSGVDLMVEVFFLGACLIFASD